MVNKCHAKRDTKTRSITYNPSLPGLFRAIQCEYAVRRSRTPLRLSRAFDENDGREGGAKTPLERNKTGNELVNTYMSDLSIQSAGRWARDAGDLCDFASLDIKAKQPWNRPEFILRNSATNDMLVFHL